jgi:hypothetical protein
MIKSSFAEKTESEKTIMFRAKVVFSLAVLALHLMVSTGFSTEGGKPPGKAGEGAHEITRFEHLPPNYWQLPPSFHIDRAALGVMISTDNDTEVSVTPSGFALPVRYHGRTPNWDEAMKHLSSHPNGSVVWLALSGHGSSSDGGVATKDPATHLTYSNLRDEHVRVIQAKLRPDAPVILLGCHVGTSNNLTKMARKLQRRVVANTGTVYSNYRGEGVWVEFRP